MLQSFSEHVIVSGKPKPNSNKILPPVQVSVSRRADLVDKVSSWVLSCGHITVIQASFPLLLKNRIWTGTGLPLVGPSLNHFEGTSQFPAPLCLCLYLRAVGSPGLQVTWISLAGNVYHSNTISSVYFVKSPFKFLINFFQWVEILIYYLWSLKREMKGWWMIQSILLWFFYSNTLFIIKEW